MSLKQGSISNRVPGIDAPSRFLGSCPEPVVSPRPAGQRDRRSEEPAPTKAPQNTTVSVQQQSPHDRGTSTTRRRQGHPTRHPAELPDLTTRPHEPAGPHPPELTYPAAESINRPQGIDGSRALVGREVFRSTCLAPRKSPKKRHPSLRGVAHTRKKATVTLFCEEESLPPLRIVGHVPARGKEMWHGHCQLP